MGGKGREGGQGGLGCITLGTLARAKEQHKTHALLVKRRVEGGCVQTIKLRTIGSFRPSVCMLCEEEEKSKSRQYLRQTTRTI